MRRRKARWDARVAGFLNNQEWQDTRICPCASVGRTRNVVAPTSLAGQFERPYGPMRPPTMFTIPVLRYMKTYGLTHEQLAMVSIVQREWAAKNPRATFKMPITVDDVLNSRMIAYPFRLLQCCLVTDGGGALILVAAGAPATSRRSRSTSSAPARASRPRWSWCGRYVRRLRHDHYLERTVVRGGIRETRSSRRPSNLNMRKYIP
jgi:acetyl-CoA acetyltransferase